MKTVGFSILASGTHIIGVSTHNATWAGGIAGIDALGSVHAEVHISSNELQITRNDGGLRIDIDINVDDDAQSILFSSSPLNGDITYSSNGVNRNSNTDGDANGNVLFPLQ